MKVAIATDDLETLSQEHFGDAKFYLIYEITKNEHKLLKKIKNTSGEEEGHGDPKKARRVASLIGDVDAMVAYAVGPNAVRMKEKYLIILFKERKKIDDVIREIQKRINDLESKKGIVVI